MGNRGLAAASIGWTLAGCILIGFGAGTWLDNKFGTSFWLPLLFLVGVVAGFREMFRTLAEISQAPRDSKSTSQQAASTSSPVAHRSLGALAEQGAETPKRQRLFTVPPPPFMEQPPQREAVDLSPQAIQRRLTQGEAEREEGRDDAV
jgi:hypothetical protein